MSRLFGLTTDEVDFGALSTLNGVVRASCSYWFFPDFAGSASFARVLGQHSGGFNGVWLFSRAGTTSVIRCFILTGANHVGDTPALTDGVWQHHHWVFDGSGATPADKLRFWLNGVETTLVYVTMDSTVLGATAANLQVGVQQSASSSMIMRLAEVYLWDRIYDDLSSIARIMRGCPPRSNIQFDAGISPTPGMGDSPEIDRSPNALSGTVTGTSVLVPPPGVQLRSSCGGSLIPLLE